MTTVTLTRDEITAASSIGEKREALRKHRSRSEEYKDAGGTSVFRNQIGAVAEYALAKHLGADILRDWCDTKSFSETHWNIKCDAGKNLHVRATKLPKGGLILHPYDPSDGAFILAIVDLERLCVKFVGWIRGGPAKTDQYWKSTGPGFAARPAFLVPQSELLPFDTLPERDIR